MSDFRLYGGDFITASELDVEVDLIPLRDNSAIGNAKHKKISVAQIASIIRNLDQGVLTASGNPTVLDLPIKSNAIWYNTTLQEVYHWANIGGALYRSKPWNIYFSIDSLSFTADSTLITADYQ